MPVVAALRRHHARARLQQRIEAGLIVFGAAIAERVDRHIDDARGWRPEAFVIEAELAHPARAQVFDHDVGFVCESVDDFAALIGRKIQREAAFALVPSEEAEAEVAKRVALEAFDLDNFGAELREDHRAVRTGDVAGKVEYRDPIERRSLFSFFSATQIIFRRDSAGWLSKPLQGRM